MKVLIVAPNWIGDAVMSFSLLQALYADSAWADSNGSPCEIHVLAPVVTADVYRCSSVVAKVHVEPFVHGAFQVGLRWRVGRSLRALRFDRAVVLPNSLKSALVPWFAGIPWRSGYSGELRSAILKPVFPKPLKTNKPPMIQWYGRLAGYDASAQLPWPQLNVSPALQRAILERFELKPGFLAVTPGAEFGPAKRWPASHFAATVSAYLRLHSARQVVLAGGPKDQAFAQDIVQAVSPDLQHRVLNVCGQTTVQQVIELLSVAWAVVTNDSGLMHVAAALNVPVHAVFGSSSPEHTPPLSQKAKVYSLGLSCSPCFQRTCPLGHLACLKDLPPEMVIDGLLEQARQV